MEIKIKEKLKDLEQKFNVKIIYACETGSRAWGFPSPDSDYDVRVIYKHETDWYLSLYNKKDTIEYMSEDGELDITGWDVRKCLKLMWKSNGALLERLQSPIVYKEENDIALLLRTYSERCFNPLATLYHYYGMAKNSFSETEGKVEIKLKTLFYALRATLACKWIIEMDAVPPIIFMNMVNELRFDDKIKTRIEELKALKSVQPENYMHLNEKKLLDFIKEELDYIETKITSVGGRKEKELDLDALFLQLVKNP